MVHLCRTRFGHARTVTSLQRTVSCFVTKLCLTLVAAPAFSACLLQLLEQDLSLVLTSQTSSIKPWILSGTDTVEQVQTKAASFRLHY